MYKYLGSPVLLGTATLFFAFLFSLQVQASVDVATCSNPKGKAYYPYLGVVPKNKAGWVDDAITGGITTLKLKDDGTYDILFIDAFKQIISSVDDGARIMPVSKGKQAVTFLVAYPHSVEAYTFLVNNDGKAEYFHVQARGGDGAVIAKGSLMRGECAFVNLNLIK
jgi:hypothetical protein